MDASSFALWIHQNTPTFCDDIEEFSLAVDGFCDADIMKTDDDVVGRSSALQADEEVAVKFASDSICAASDRQRSSDGSSDPCAKVSSVVQKALWSN